jgi:hypothetical protein
MSDIIIDAPIDEIENNIMSVLCSNMDLKFTFNSLFNKILDDKYEKNQSSIIHSNFKSKFLTILYYIKFRYNDIKIFNDNNVTWIVYISDNENDTNNYLTWNNINSIGEFPVNLDYDDYANMFQYLYYNNFEEFIKWTNYAGNTVFHELMKLQDKFLIKNLLERNKFNFTIRNSENKTPIEIQSSLEIIIMLFQYLINKNYLLNNQLEKNNFKYFEEINDLNEHITYLKSYKYQKKIIDESNTLNIIFIKINNLLEYKLCILSFIILFYAIIIFC